MLKYDPVDDETTLLYELDPLKREKPVPLGERQCMSMRLAVSPNNKYLTIFLLDIVMCYDLAAGVSSKGVEQKIDYNTTTSFDQGMDVNLLISNDGYACMSTNDAATNPKNGDLASAKFYKWNFSNGKIDFKEVKGRGYAPRFPKRLSGNQLVYVTDHKPYIITLNLDDGKDELGLVENNLEPWSIDIDGEGNIYAMMYENFQIVHLELDKNTSVYNVSSFIANYSEKQSSLTHDIACVPRESENSDVQIFYSCSQNSITSLRLTQGNSFFQMLMKTDKEQGDTRLKLCNNGDMYQEDIGIYNDAFMVGTTSLTDDHAIQGTPTLAWGQECEPLESGVSTLTGNGLYIAKLSEDNWSLDLNIPNTSSFSDFCQTGGTRFNACTKSYKITYCDKGNNNDNDERCSCYLDTDDLLVRAGFNLQLIKSDPLTYEQLSLAAPCLLPSCRQFYREDSITGKYLQSLKCEATTVVVCQSLINFTESSVGGDAIVIQNCGATIINCNESQPCPAGASCNDQNICESICLSDDDCGFTQMCKSGVCVNPSLECGTKWGQIGAIIVLSILLIVVVVLLALKYFGKI